MEMEHINENTIRVNIENTDLEERGITFLDLLGNQKQIENFFYSILEEVDIHEEFQETDAVTFQVVPNKSGLELYISKGNTLQDETDDSLRQMQSEEFEGRLLDHSDEDAELTDELTEYQNNEENLFETAVYSFADFNDLILLSKKLFLESGVSNLYHYKDHYYLELILFVEEMIERFPEDEKAIATEFGEPEKVTGDVLVEYGKMLMETNALELIRLYFPN